jgi:hypothetical protein
MKPLSWSSSAWVRAFTRLGGTNTERKEQSMVRRCWKIGIALVALAALHLAASPPALSQPSYTLTLIPVSNPLGLNNKGQVVGAIPFQTGLGGIFHAVVYDTSTAAQPFDLGQAIGGGPISSRATSINDFGQVAIRGYPETVLGKRVDLLDS